MVNWYVVNTKRFGAWFRKNIPPDYRLKISYDLYEVPHLVVVKKGWFWIFGEKQMFSLYPFGEIPEITVASIEGEKLAKQMLEGCPYEYELVRNPWGDFDWKDLLKSPIRNGGDQVE